MVSSYQPDAGRSQRTAPKRPSTLPASLIAAANASGGSRTLGSVYPYDAHQSSARLSAAYVSSNVRPGAVIVLHDGRDRGRRTADVLRRVLPVLRARGYRVVTLTELAALHR